MSDWLEKHTRELAKKKVLLFIVCGTTADDPEQQQQLINHNLSPALRRSVTAFFPPGRCIISKLSLKDHILLKIGAWLQKDPQKKAVMNQGFDLMDRKNLDSLIAAASLMKGQITFDSQPGKGTRFI